MIDWSTIANNLIPAVIALLAIWLTSRFALSRSKATALWERKALAYSEIFEALGVMDLSYAEDFTAFERGDGENPAALITFEDFKEARKRLHKAISRETWILPQEVRTEMLKMEKKIAKHNPNYVDHLLGCSDAVSATIKTLRDIAKDDIGAH